MTNNPPRAWFLVGPEGAPGAVAWADAEEAEVHHAWVPDLAAWAEAGCPPLVVVVPRGAAGGVARAWRMLRRRGLQVPFLAAIHPEDFAETGTLAEVGAVDFTGVACTIRGPDRRASAVTNPGDPLEAPPTVETSTWSTDPLLPMRVARLARRTAADDPFLPQETCSPLVVRFVFDLPARRLLHLQVVDSGGIVALPPTVDPSEAGWEELLHPDDRGRLADRFARLAELADGQRWVHEARVRSADGGYRWLRIATAVHDRNADGAPVRLFGSAVDITPFRRPEAALAAVLEGSARVGAELFPDLVASLGEFLGLRAVVLADLQGGGWTPLATWSRDPDSPAAGPPEPGVEDLLQGEVVPPSRARDEGWLVLPVRRRDGVVVGGLALHLDAGFSPGATALTVLDALTARAGDELDRRRAGDELRRGQERLALAVNGTDLCLWDWDARTGEVFLDPEWRARLADFTLDPHLAADGSAIAHPDDVEGLARAIGAHVRGETEFAEAEARFRTRDGSWLYGLVRGKIVERDAQRLPVRIIGTLTDLTQRRRMESRLAAADRLATVGTLASGVAHELNNPLAYVLGNLEYIASAWDADRLSSETARAHLRQALVEAVEGAERVRAIVADLGLLARVEDPTPRPVDLERVVRAAVRVVAPQARRRAVIEERLQRLPPVMGNEARLCQVVVALLANAIGAMPPDRPIAENHVRVRLGAEGGHARVVVEDNGVGMSAEVARRALDPFFTTHGPGGGMGLGLAIVNGVVGGLGGRLELESLPGRGSTVRVLLPLGGAVAVAPDPSMRPRILVVDDEPNIREVVGMFLAPAYDVVTVSDAPEALARLLAGEPFDAMLADLSLPGPSGVELWAQVRDAVPSLGRRTGFATGGALAEDREALERLGDARILEKPFTRAELLRFVDGLLRA